MTTVDDILRLIGLTTIVVVVSVLLVAVIFFAYGALAGMSAGKSQNASAQDQLLKALTDYTYSLDLVKEQTQRLDMYYAAKTSTEMSRIEFQSWLGMIKGLTDEFIARENDAIAQGEAYMGFLSPESDEYTRVQKNEATCREDIRKVKYTYNGNVYIYNQQYGTTYGEIAYMD